jgi:hypothetical protein
VNPDVVRAVEALSRDGSLPQAVAPRLRRVAAGALVSVRDELRALLYLGVLVTVAGVGLLVKDNLSRLGPVTIAVAIGAVSAGCLVWTNRQAAPFTWGETKETHLAFDYVLLLGALLVATDLAFIETKFTPLGASWPWHLFFVGVFYAALAFRFDSKTLFSLSLTSLAAWRGVRVWFPVRNWDEAIDDRLFYEALACGIVSVAIGKLLERARRKPHFEPVGTYFGWLLVFGAFVGRSFADASSWPQSLVLLATGALVSWFAFEERRIGLVAMGLAGAAWGTGDLAERAIHSLDLGEKSSIASIVVIAAGVVAILHRANRALEARR